MLSPRSWRLARLVITRPHFMSPLVERHELAARKFRPTLFDCVQVTGFRLFFKLRHQCACGGVLHVIGKLLQSLNRLLWVMLLCARRVFIGT